MSLKLQSLPCSSLSSQPFIQPGVLRACFLWRLYVMNNNVLVCQGLGKTFNDGVAQIQVLSEVDLSVKLGELIAIVGNSGSGKSTLLHLLGGLDAPTEGKVILNGEDLATLSEKE